MRFVAATDTAPMSKAAFSEKLEEEIRREEQRRASRQARRANDTGSDTAASQRPAAVRPTNEFRYD